MGVRERGHCAACKGEKRLGPWDFTVRSELPGPYLARSVREAGNTLHRQFVSLVRDVRDVEMCKWAAFYKSEHITLMLPVISSQG